MVCLNLYLASLGWRGYWFSTSDDQLDQPKEYFHYIINNSFLRHMVDKHNDTRVWFTNGGGLKLTILTPKKARSGRADFVTFDEEREAEEELHDAAKGVISKSTFGMIFHISTPVKGNVFEKNYDKLKLWEITTGVQHTFKKPWWEIGFLARNKEFYEEEKRTKPEWWYRQEYCAEFTSPMGGVFKNIVYDVYEEFPDKWELKLPLTLHPKTVSGLDWNPVAGHWLVGGHWLENMRGFLVTHSIPIATGYSHQLTKKAYETIKPYCTAGRSLNIEEGGINEAFCDWFKTWIGNDKNKRNMHVRYEEWDSAGVNKTNAALALLDKTIYVDRIRFPDLAKMIENCHWVEDTDRLLIDKDPINSPHALDAFLHAVNPVLMKEIGMRRVEWYGSTK